VVVVFSRLSTGCVEGVSVVDVADSFLCANLCHVVVGGDGSRPDVACAAYGRHYAGEEELRSREDFSKQSAHIGPLAGADDILPTRVYPHMHGQCDDLLARGDMTQPVGDVLYF
jgi:hypothetical protein